MYIFDIILTRVSIVIEASVLVEYLIEHNIYCPGLIKHSKPNMIVVNELTVHFKLLLNEVV